MCFILAEFISSCGNVVDVCVWGLHLLANFRVYVVKSALVVFMPDFDGFSAAWVTVIKRETYFVVLTLGGEERRGYGLGTS